MTRINTNVSSLVAQNTLSRSNADLNQALTRLSTGLRINTGKDDPAGLIASENLRSDITSIRRAISNTDRANQVIATADSALGQVSSLLNDIRGLVTESANAGALSDEQRGANQLQVDSSLEALNRIAQTTTFQGRRLLDGSLDFITTAGTNFAKLGDLQIDQANLGSAGSINVDITVSTAATQATISVANIPNATAAVNATGTLTFNDAAATASAGSVNITVAQQESTGSFTFGTTTGAGLTVTTKAGGNAAGAFGGASGGINIVFTDNDADDSAVASATYTQGTNVIAVTADFDGSAAGNAGVTEAAIATAIAGINGGADFTVTAIGTTALVAADVTTYSDVATGGRDAGNQTLTITGNAGAANNITVNFVEAAGVGTTPSVTDNGGGSYTINVDDTATTTFAAISAAITGLTEVASVSGGTGNYIGSSEAALNSPGINAALTGGFDAGADVITLNANSPGTGGNRTLTFVEANVSNNFIGVVDDGSTVTVTVDDTSTYNVTDISAAIDSQLSAFSASVTATAGNGSFVAATDAGTTSNIGGGVTGSGGLTNAVVLELVGSTGAEVLSFGAGTSITELINGINLVSDATGVSVAASPSAATTLVLTGSTYGTTSVVDLNVISEGATSTPAGTFTNAIGQGLRDNGSNVVASINGVSATGTGNSLSINTATLDIGTTVDANFTGTSSFTITGGGALFQLGPDVVSNQQSRLGIKSVNTAQLGGVTGKLFSLGTGGTAELSLAANTAASIVEEAIDQVTTLRGRLGAFQRTTLETNKNALNDTLINLTDAESTIRDADFASETAALTRAQILVQSGTTVLQISNQNPQNVLSLLR
ncbi:MAG: flagellin [Pirellulales bacterium]